MTGQSYEPGVPVIGLAHGSRHHRGGEAIEALMQAVGTLTETPARVAYLDLAEPDLTTVATELAAAGHQLAIVVPLLFTAAFHATVDVPEAVREACESAGIALVVADIVGTEDDVATILELSLRRAGAAEHSVLLFAVGSSNPAANAAVADLAARLGARRHTTARAAFGTCAPRAEDVLAELTPLGRPIAIVPLFLADGLLLDPMRARAAERGWLMTDPLGDRAATIVRRRYDSARSTVGLG